MGGDLRREIRQQTKRHPERLRIRIVFPCREDGIATLVLPQLPDQDLHQAYGRQEIPDSPAIPRLEMAIVPPEPFQLRSLVPQQARIVRASAQGVRLKDEPTRAEQETRLGQGIRRSVIEKAAKYIHVPYDVLRHVPDEHQLRMER